MSKTKEIFNAPPTHWSTIPSSNGLLKQQSIHMATSKEYKISKRNNVETLVRAATKHIPNAGKIIDQHFSTKTYAVNYHLQPVKHLPKYDHIHFNNH